MWVRWKITEAILQQIDKANDSIKTFFVHKMNNYDLYLSLIIDFVST